MTKKLLKQFLNYEKKTKRGGQIKKLDKLFASDVNVI